MSILLNQKYNKLFIFWLITLILLIILMIIIGGLTRLTDSGLSITKWELFKGIIPPVTKEKWEYYFSLYKEIPQYYLINKDITLNDFKVIYYWEYFHRLLGRFIGLFFLLPFIFFIYKKILRKKDMYSFLIIFFLILFQGFVGWYMVKSGLIENVTVSHYRLSIHLLIAFIILTCLFWNFLNFKFKENKNFFINNLNLISIKLLIFLIFLQIVIGAFVSGLDAGKIYQTWPLMNNSYFPNDINFKNYNEFLNLNDRSVVQFIHRNLAYLIFFLTLYIGFLIKKFNKVYLYKAYFYLLIFIFIQIFLGISSLISDLNIIVALMHQISSIFLIIFSINFYYKSIN